MNPLVIIQYIRQHNMTKSEFCKICSITIQMLDDIVFYGKCPNYKVAEKISKATKLGIYELYSC